LVNNPAESDVHTGRRSEEGGMRRSDVVNVQCPSHSISVADPVSESKKKVELVKSNIMKQSRTLNSTLL
jgi:hypothetical protein